MRGSFFFLQIYRCNCFNEKALSNAYVLREFLQKYPTIFFSLCFSQPPFKSYLKVEIQNVASLGGPLSWINGARSRNFRQFKHWSNGQRVNKNIKITAQNYRRTQTKQTWTCMDKTGEDWNGLHLGKFEKRRPTFLQIFRLWPWFCKSKTLGLPNWCLELIISKIKKITSVKSPFSSLLIKFHLRMASSSLFLVLRHMH